MRASDLAGRRVENDGTNRGSSLSFSEQPLIPPRRLACPWPTPEIAKPSRGSRLLFTRAESARALGMSLSHFQRHVQPHLRCVRSGRLRLFRPRDLERWLESVAIVEPGDQPLLIHGSRAEHFRSMRGARCRPDGPHVRPGPSSLEGPLTLVEVRDQFLAAAGEGIALNKWRRPYRPRAAEDLKSLNQLPAAMLSRPVDRVTRGEVQALIDQLSRRELSASRISSIVNALRSLYRFAQERELTTRDPARNVRLPIGEPATRDRVATPAEFNCLLEALWDQTPEEVEEGEAREPRAALEDALPYAIAAYGTARSQEIEVLDWRDVDLKLGIGELAADPAGRKPGGSRRVVPLVKPLRNLLIDEWRAQGEPSEGRVCPPTRIRKSGRKSMRSLQRRARRRWLTQDLEPIGLQETRHTAATWLDHAGISPKVCSQLMGHKTPEYQPGAARITLQRYTHVLPGELERARDLLDEFIENTPYSSSTI
jgi:integrase